MPLELHQHPHLGAPGSIPAMGVQTLAKFAELIYGWPLIEQDHSNNLIFYSVYDRKFSSGQFGHFFKSGSGCGQILIKMQQFSFSGAVKPFYAKLQIKYTYCYVY